MSTEQEALTLTPSERLALTSIVSEYLRTLGHTEQFVDVARDVTTTSEDLLKRLLGDPPQFTCTRCGFVSYNRNDVKERHCVRCHTLVDDLEQFLATRPRSRPPEIELAQSRILGTVL